MGVSIKVTSQNVHVAFLISVYRKLSSADERLAVFRNRMKSQNHRNESCTVHGSPIVSDILNGNIESDG
jgi:hypothetical protein